MSQTTSKIIRCFIIMPFAKAEFNDQAGNVKRLNKKDLDFIYEHYLVKAIESYSDPDISFEAKRYNSGSGNFMKGVVTNLYTYDFVLADITGLNPNVMYELGIRHTLKNNTIMVTQSVQQIPADLSQYIAVVYDYAKRKNSVSYKKFESKLHDSLRERLGKLEESDNPVRDFLFVRKELRNQELVELYTGFLNMVFNFKTHMEYFLNSFNDSYVKWTLKSKAPIPQLITEWEDFYFKLIQTPKYFRMGNYFMNVCLNLRAIKTNMPTIMEIVLIKGITNPKNLPFNELPVWNNGMESIITSNVKNCNYIKGLEEILKEIKGNILKISN